MRHTVILSLFSLLIGCQPTNEGQSSEPETPTTAFEDPPAWAGEVIWYQIMLERFRNGDPTNDPTPEDIAGTYPGFVPEGWHVTPWTQDWYELDDYMEGIENETDFYGNPVTSFSAKAQLKRFGGDLQGVLDQMDYLDSLGVTAIFFNPLNDAPSLHKYDARHWRHIDRNFGPDPRGDVEIMNSETPDDPSTWKMTNADQMFVEVVAAFHERGIKVILDYSWNHTGHTFWAWQDLLGNQQKSKYADWYWVKQFDDPATEENEFEYNGWAGVFDLPEIKETVFIDHSKGVKASEGNILLHEVKNHIFAITRKWLDPNGDGNPEDGVDGYRLDVAAEVPLGFWREYRQVVRDVNPDTYLVGEVWWAEWPDYLLEPEPFVRGDVFDSPMNYRWYRAARHFFNASPTSIPPSEFVDSLISFSDNLRPQTNRAMMNLTASHDVPRVLTSLFNKNKYKVDTNPSETSNYKIHKPDETTYQTLYMLLAHQYTYVGAPHIWAGDEMGMWGGDDPSTRKPLIWPDYEFEEETTHPLGRERPTDKVRFNKQVFNYHRQMIKIRKDNPVLSNGEIAFIHVDDGHSTLAYSRYSEEGEVIAAFNASEEPKRITLTPKTAGAFEDVLGNNVLTQTEDGIQLTLAGRSAAILIRQ
ncbi:MAG: alpha-glucosidase C-terminal domain-containing protein [Cyclobacteriaceae bacterium]